jgi:hypothetical protein
MTQRWVRVAVAPMFASAALLAACQPTPPKQTAQDAANAETAAAAKNLAATTVQPRTYDKVEYDVIRPTALKPPLATETPTTMVRQDAAMKPVNPAALKAMAAAPAPAKP